MEKENNKYIVLMLMLTLTHVSYNSIFNEYFQNMLIQSEAFELQYCNHHNENQNNKIKSLLNRSCCESCYIFCKNCLKTLTTHPKKNIYLFTQHFSIIFHFNLNLYTSFEDLPPIRPPIPNIYFI